MDYDTAEYYRDIAEYYRKRHAAGPYGMTGHKRVKDIFQAFANTRITTVLDWGAGSRTLAKALAAHKPEWRVDSYDPYVPDISARPTKKYDAVITTDVLEHIPHEGIDAAIADIVGLTKSYGYHFIANFPARDSFPDGRNIHLIQEGAAWWKAKFEAHGVVVTDATDVSNVALNPTTKREEVVYRAARILFRKTYDT
jgi:hypothetical protein